MDVVCDYCGDPINPNLRSNWQGIHGYQRMAGVRPSGKHGGSDIARREVLPEFVHEKCMSLWRAGVNPDQLGFAEGEAG